jgi:signal peptidase I
VVWDNDRQPRDPAGAIPPRWEVVGSGGRWNADNARQPRAFQHAGDPLDWVRYQHNVWRKDQVGRVPWRWSDQDIAPPAAGPVDNMLGYNAGIDLNPLTGEPQPRDTGRDSTMWVGDLCLECEAEFAAGAEVVLELSKGVNRFRATFGNGQVALGRVGEQGPKAFGTPTRPCNVNAGTHKLRFANIDCRLWVWVDGKRIDFGPEGDYIPVERTGYDPDDTQKEGWVRENDIDAPAQIGARGSATVRAIKLHRDIYYTRISGDTADIFYVQPGHYLCLGDNSAQSSDSRRWGAVPERLMLGKAVFVFWPGYPRPNRIGFIK